MPIYSFKELITYVGTETPMKFVRLGLFNEFVLEEIWDHPVEYYDATEDEPACIRFECTGFVEGGDFEDGSFSFFVTKEEYEQWGEEAIKAWAKFE